MFDSPGAYLTDTQELSSPEEHYVVAGNDKPRERGWWRLRSGSGAPGSWAAEKRGHYSKQHQTKESYPDLLLGEGQDSSTQTVVKLRELIS